MLGYSLSAQDDDSYMLGPNTFLPVTTIFGTWHFGNINAPHPATCKLCGSKVDPLYVSPSYRVKKRTTDATFSNDGYLLVSRRVKDFCSTEFGNVQDFKALPGDSNFFWLDPERTVVFDTKKRNTRFENLCPQCGQYYDVIGATPVYLNTRTINLDFGFWKTDIVFGSGHEKSPIVVVGTDVYLWMKKENFKGLEFREVKSST